MHAFGDMISSGSLKAIAHPDLQEVSTAPCDTGSPLDVLRTEFPHIEFLDDLFPDFWPRDASIMPPKAGTIYEDCPSALEEREERIHQWIRNLDDVEVIVVTHGSFAHFLFGSWEGEPGASMSRGVQLRNGEARPMTLPNKTQPDSKFKSCGILGNIGPMYPPEGRCKDGSSGVFLTGIRDCGIFTARELR